MASKQSEFATPLGSATRGRLEFARGGSGITIRGDGDMDDLVRARFEGTVPMVLADDGKVTIEYPLVSPSEWLRPDRRRAELVLNHAVPWELVFSGGVSRLRADLAGLALRSLEIARGASALELGLPEPAGAVRIRVGGGASKVLLRRPRGVAVDVSVGGGVSNLAFDDQRWGAVGGELHLASPLAAEHDDRYEIEIGGGASELTIAEAGATA
jgi:hypothetical protein